MEYDDFEDCFYEYGKMSDGKTMKIVFYSGYNGSKSIGSYDYSVFFAIASKKKYINNYLLEEGNLDLEHMITGNGSLEGLIWAFRQIQIFITRILKPDDRLFVTASDNRRLNIYTHFLCSRLGFKKIHSLEYGTCLIYQKHSSPNSTD